MFNRLISVAHIGPHEPVGNLISSRTHLLPSGPRHVRVSEHGYPFWDSASEIAFQSTRPQLKGLSSMCTLGSFQRIWYIPCPQGRWDQWECSYLPKVYVKESFANLIVQAANSLQRTTGVEYSDKLFVWAAVYLGLSASALVAVIAAKLSATRLPQ